MYKIVGGIQTNIQPSFTELMSALVVGVKNPTYFCSCGEECVFKLADEVMNELIKDKIVAGKDYPKGANPIVIILNKELELMATIQPRN